MCKYYLVYGRLAVKDCTAGKHSYLHTCTHALTHTHVHTNHIIFKTRVTQHHTVQFIHRKKLKILNTIVPIQFKLVKKLNIM